MNSIKCWNCGLVNFATVTHCRRCKNELSNGATGQSGYYGQNLQPNQTGMPPSYPSPVNPQPYHETGYGSPYDGTPNNQTGYTSPYGGTPNNQTGYASPYSGTPTGMTYSENAAYMPANPYYGYAATHVKLKQGLAIASLVIGIVGLVICLPGGIAGLTCGIMAVKKAKEKPMEYGGKELAIAGIIINSFLLLLIPVVIAIVIPNLFAARGAANEASAIGTLRRLSSAEAIYQSTAGGGSSYGTLEEMERQGLVKTGLLLDKGYKFKVIVSNCTGSSARYCTPHYVILATPEKYGSRGTGKRSFYVDETGVIRAADRVGMDADSSAPPLTMERGTPSTPYDD